MSARTMSWALEAGRDKQLDPAARMVLVALGYHANRWGRSWPSVDLIVRDTGYSARTVTRALASIEEAGIVEGDRRPGWTTLWIFPPEARPKLSTTPATVSKRGATVAPEPVVEPVKEGQGAKSYPQATFLLGTGWVQPYGDGAA